MAREWYCELHTKNGRPRKTPRVFGPLRVRELKHLARTGQLLPDDRIRRGETGSWREARSIRGLFEHADQPPVPAQRRATDDDAQTTTQPAKAPAATATLESLSEAEFDTHVHRGGTSPELPAASAGHSTRIEPSAHTDACDSARAPDHAATGASPAAPENFGMPTVQEWKKRQLLQQSQWMARQLQQAAPTSSGELPVAPVDWSADYAGSGDIPLIHQPTGVPPSGSGELPSAAGLLPSQLQALQQDPWYALLQRRIQEAGIAAPVGETDPRQWYRESHGIVSGPMLFEDLVLLARSGRLGVGDNIRWGANGPWIPLFPTASGSSRPAIADPASPLPASAWDWGSDRRSAVRRPRPPKLPPVRIPPPSSAPPQPVDLSEPSESPSNDTASQDAAPDESEENRQRCSDAAAQLLAQFSGRSRGEGEKKAVDPLKLLRAKPKAFTPPAPPPSAPPRDVATGAAPARPAHATRTDIPRVPRKRPSRLPGQAQWIALAAGVLLVLGGIYLIIGGSSDARICRDLESIWSEFKQLRERHADAAEVQAFLDRARPTLRRHRAYLEKSASRTERAKQRLLHLTQSLQEAIAAADSGRPEIPEPLEKTIEDGFADVHRLLGTTP
ncbi:MAG: hypothetical protein D6725_13570 [Planctomycetota bacterium]|nr:MAG: hypothetical protein D6725_13570 [Planctomycetota bacterium]